MILIADGFDHYGTGATGRANMALGPYAAVGGNGSPSTNQPRTGTCAFGGSGSTTGLSLRRVLPGNFNNIGFGTAQWFNALPGGNNSFLLWQWRDIGNSAICSVVLQSTGDIHIKRGSHSGTLVAQTSVPIIVTQTYQHIEAFFTFAGASGAVELRVNGETVIDEVNVDIGAANVVRQFYWGISSTLGTAIGPYWVEDMYVYDDQGDYNNAIGIGDLKLAPIYPNQDTAQTDWTRNTGSNDFEAIDDTVQDGDTTYLASTMVGERSEFELEDSPPLAETVKFLASYTLARKTDAGDARLQVGIGSADIGSPAMPSEVLGSAHTITEAYGYYMDVFEEDPATGAPFTPSSVDDARLILKRA